MEYDITLLVVLALVGIVAGGINTVAGGGSNLTLPVLMLLGLPADVANGTNRVAVALQCVVGIRGFRNHDRLDEAAILPILVPTLIGGVFGSLAAAVIPVTALKPILLITIISMSLIILIRPNFIAPPDGTPVVDVRDNRGAWWMLLFAGIYSGFVQAGVGFILLAALAGGLRYDLVRANALKMVCSLGSTLIALGVFLYFDMIRWVPGLALAAGTMLGAWASVKFAVRAKQSTIKWFLFVMTLCSCVAALVF